MKNIYNKTDVLLLTETNFVLDVIFEQSADCDYLYQLVAAKKLKLVIPEYAFAEGEGNIQNSLRKRIQTIDMMLSQVRQAERSSYHNLGGLTSELQRLREQSEHGEPPHLHTRLGNLKGVADIIPYLPEHAIQAELRTLKQLAPLKDPDRKIYESILWFLRQNQPPRIPMLFLTRDRNDFDFPYIHDELAQLGIALFFSAGDCVRRIRDILEPAEIDT